MRSLGYITESELANQLELLGEEAESAENYQTAATLYQGAVDLGNTEAALWLGWLYMKGDGMAMDEARGLALFERAANSGYNVAYHSVATSYEHGWGTPVDLEKALYWYQKYYGKMWFSDGNDIVIRSDSHISREAHARLGYDPKKNRFRLIPANNTNNIYLNGEVIDAAAPLNAYDLIEFGETKLIFVPLCTDRFTWEDGKKDEAGHAAV